MCVDCGKQKPLLDFHKKRSCLQPACKPCANKRAKKYRAENPEKVRDSLRRYYHDNKEKCSIDKRIRYEKNRDELKKKQREYNRKNRESIARKARQYREKNREIVAARNRDWKQRNREYVNNKAKEARQTDPMAALMQRVRVRLNDAIRRNGYKKSSKTNEILGCTWEELKLYFEELFKEGMSWQNRSEWHIDHIIPIASAKSEKELIELCHYTNLQPLWAKENMSKGARMTTSGKEANSGRS